MHSCWYQIYKINKQLKQLINQYIQDGVNNVGARNAEIGAWVERFNDTIAYAQLAIAECQGNEECIAEVREELRAQVGQLLRELSEVCRRHLSKRTLC